MSMYLSLSQLEARTTGANVISRENLTNRYFYYGKKPSVFLSHKHSEIAQLKRVAYLLEQLDSIIYVDWLDSSMPQTTCGKTAENIKEKIKKYDKFILVATEGAIASKWCNWELGFGDAHKYDSDKIALFPIHNEGYNWSGNEYLEIYPVIGYIDTYQYVSGFGYLNTGYYVFYHYGNKKAIRLQEWLSK